MANVMKIDVEEYKRLVAENARLEGKFNAVMSELTSLKVKYAEAQKTLQECLEKSNAVINRRGEVVEDKTFKPTPRSTKKTIEEVRPAALNNGFTEYSFTVCGKTIYVFVGAREESGHAECEWRTPLVLFCDGVMAKANFHPEKDKYSKYEGYVVVAWNKAAFETAVGQVQYRGRVTDICRVHEGWNPAISMSDVLSGKVMNVVKAVPDMPFVNEFDMDDIDWKEF